MDSGLITAPIILGPINGINTLDGSNHHNYNKEIVMKLLLIIFLVTGCGKYTPQLETKHKAEATTESKITTDGETRVVIESMIDLVLEVCEVKVENKIIPYSKWNEVQRECINLLQFKVAP